MTFRELIDYIFDAENPHVLYAIGISLVVSKRYFLAALLGLAVSLLLTTHGLFHNAMDAVLVGGTLTVISIGVVVWTCYRPKEKKKQEL